MNLAQETARILHEELGALTAEVDDELRADMLSTLDRARLLSSYESKGIELPPFAWERVQAQVASYRSILTAEAEHAWWRAAQRMVRLIADASVAAMAAAIPAAISAALGGDE